MSDNCTVEVTNNTPTVEVEAMAEQIPASDTAALAVLGADDAGEANLTYTWTVLSTPTGADDPNCRWSAMRWLTKTTLGSAKK